jgi:hypothetical protein
MVYLQDYTDFLTNGEFHVKNGVGGIVGVAGNAPTRWYKMVYQREKRHFLPISLVFQKNKMRLPCAE